MFREYGGWSPVAPRLILFQAKPKYDVNRNISYNQ